jgi:hypothetical protein
MLFDTYEKPAVCKKGEEAMLGSWSQDRAETSAKDEVLL